MSRTYGLIGTRPDLGGLLARAQLQSLWQPSSERTSWGLGLFDKDEVLLKRGPGGPESRLLQHVSNHRSHAFLAHECDHIPGAPSTENLPPLRYGHVLFSCQGVVEGAHVLMSPVRELLPESLTRSVRGETFTEIAFALFLAELPTESLARTRLAEPGRSANPLNPSRLKKALRSSLTTLDGLCQKQGLPSFAGDLWIHTGELMMIAHREGPLTLQVTRGREDLERWNVVGETAPPGLDQSQFVALSHTSESPSAVPTEAAKLTNGSAPSSRPPFDLSWERLPHNILLTAARGQMPQTESL